MKININNYEEWMIDYIEDNLSQEQQKQFAEFLAFHPELKGELELFQQTKLQPDLNIVFANKDALKQKEGGKVIVMTNWVRYAAGIAAVMLLFVGIRFFSGNNQNDQVAIKKYAPQQMETPFAYDRTTDKVNEVKLQVNEVKQVDKQFASEIKKQNQKEETPSPDKQIILREQMNIESIELADLKPIKVHQHTNLKNALPDVVLENESEQFASTQMSDNSKNISLNDNTSIVDWMNDAIAMGGEVGGLVESFVMKDEKNDKANNSAYKTTDVNLFGISYYSRKKSN